MLVENECFSIEQTLVIETESCDCDIFVPNVFTPNGDGKNDLFQPELHQKIENTALRIYNCWGRLLYEDKSLAHWNGFLQNKEAPAGSYYWTLDYACLQNDVPARLQKKGWLTLMRK